MKQWAQRIGLFVLLAGNTVAMASCFWMIHDDSKRQCVQRWAHSNTPSKPGQGGGCLVEKEPGNWVPEKSMYRQQ